MGEILPDFDKLGLFFCGSFRHVSDTSRLQLIVINRDWHAETMN